MIINFGPKPRALVSTTPLTADMAPAADQLLDAVQDVLDKFSGRVTLAEALGVLELAKRSLVEAVL